MFLDSVFIVNIGFISITAVDETTPNADKMLRIISILSKEKEFIPPLSCPLLIDRNL